MTIRPKYCRQPHFKRMTNFVNDFTALCNSYNIELISEAPSDDIELLAFDGGYRIEYALEPKAVHHNTYILRTEFIEEIGKP